eukprot:TRINITY_DN5117_c0_g1_i2.p1 TRINITY_DN5117_c0_g1~~TRINITY_DN5117_c0_g1_i2.p1  ORF type:complete len:551 (-),score=130.75 TRINITY_DN5117_c0_g1_i2:716-2368(-)
MPLDNPPALVRGAAEEPDVAGGSTPSRREGQKETVAEDGEEASNCPPAQTEEERHALQGSTSPAAGDALSPGSAEEELLEEMLSDKHRWTIFEDAEDEIQYLRRRGDLLAHSVLAARAEIEHLHEAGLRLQDAHEALQAEVREMAGDTAYWQALAEARAEELKEFKALHAGQQQTSTIAMASNQQQRRCGEDDEATAALSPRCPRMASASPISKLRRATSDLGSPTSASSRRRSTPGALWGMASAKDLQSLSQRKLEEQKPTDAENEVKDPSSVFGQHAKQRMQITRPDETRVEVKDAENVEEPENTSHRQDDEVMEHRSDSQELPRTQVKEIDRSALDDECWMKDPREALRAAAAEAARAEKERKERMKNRAADQEQQRRHQVYSQMPLQQAKAPEPLPSPAPSARCVPSQSVQHEAKSQEASMQSQQKSRSLGRPSRLSAACRARRDTISQPAKTPPRHRTPPPQQLLSRSPQGALMGSPMGLAPGFTSSRSSNGVRRALFSPSASVPGKKWGSGSLSRSCLGLGSPSRRESRARASSNISECATGSS